MKQQAFYIGWQDEMPSGHQHLLKRFLIGLFLAVPLLIVGVVYLQKPFNDHRFEFGVLKQITGTYYDTPVPMLVADAGMLPKGVSNAMLLVGFGKFGAKGIMEEVAELKGGLKGRKITLEGTLIYGDGKAMMELTNETAAFIQKLEGQAQREIPQTENQQISLKGEILDPKCYFGVMKPGEGKIHKSCAIRCISGGIPPVFRHETGDVDNPYRYYLVADQNGKNINSQILPFVAEPLTMKGAAGRFMDWDILYVNLTNLPINTLRLSELCSGQAATSNL